MKTLIFNGSPRKNGDTVSLLNKTLEHLEGEVKIVNAYFCDIHPCVDCRYCWSHIGCAFKDEMQEVYEYLKDCDNIIITSPVYYSEVTGQLLSVLSRLQIYYSASHFQGVRLQLKTKKGAIILVGGGDGSPDRAAETAKMLLRCMNVKESLSPVISHNTNNVPAIKDEQAVNGAKAIAEFFNKKG